MSSNDSVQRWAERWSASRLVRPVRADREAARRRLELADRNLERAGQAQKTGDHDAALIFAEQALINAADALLARDGWSANSHVVRFSYPSLPPVYTTERGLIDQVRSARNTAQYDARDRVAAGLAADAIRVAERAVDEVRAIL
jgi:HEPN domain-containing protein